MNCQSNWDRGFIVEHLNKSFVDGKYNDTRKQILFQREQARFPETMEYVAVMKNRITYREMGEQLRLLHRSYKEIESKIHRVHAKELRQRRRDDSLTETLDKHFTKLQKCATQTNELEFIHSNLKTQLQKEGVLKVRKVSFIHACPKEDCKGFLSTAWKCGLCENWTCPHCLELKGLHKDDPNNPHECKEENVKSAELIKKSTKKCPKCAIPIYKISGCDQMFCTKCHIAFSWKTGEIDNGTIHNPHYFQCQRELPQALNEEQRQALENNANRDLCGPCGDDNMPNWHLFQGILDKLYRIDKIINNHQYYWAINIFRQVTHLNNVIMRPMRRECRNFQDQQEIRAKYILSLMSKGELEHLLVTNDAIFKRNMSCLQIYDLIITIFRESINKITEGRTKESVIEAQTHVKKITDYANRELARLSYIYSRSIFMFSFLHTTFYKVNFTKTAYLALKNSGIIYPTVTHPLRRMYTTTKATTWKSGCFGCKKQIVTPYYTSSWTTPTNSSICLKCVFHQPHKTPELISALEQEGKDLIVYYTTKKNTGKLEYVKTQLNGWIEGGASK
jgi:hypothetical protein